MGLDTIKELQINGVAEPAADDQRAQRPIGTRTPIIHDPDSEVPSSSDPEEVERFLDAFLAGRRPAPAVA
jgi:hypothetical protein